MVEKKKLKFDLSSQQLKIKSLLNKEFIQTEVWAISDEYPNRNQSTFTLESLNIGKNTVLNKPVLGAFGVNSKPDFDAHNGELEYDPEVGVPFWNYEDGERVLGVIRESDTVDIKEKNGLHWLVFSCCLWTYYNYKAVKNVLKNKTKKVSVEVEVESSHIDENGIEVIDQFNLLAVTILGNDVSEGIPDAHMSLLDKMEYATFSKQMACLNFAYTKMDNKKAINKLEEGRTVAEIFGETQSSDIKAEKSVDSNLDPNEEKEEIIMERGGIVGMQLTYEQKRELIEIYLRSILKETATEEENCYTWVADLTDTLVYFNINGVYYSAPYVITETEEAEKFDAVVKMEEKSRVTRSWEKFTEEKEVESEEEKEEPTEEKEVESTENAESVEEKEVESAEKKEVESTEPVSTEEKEVESAEEKPTEGEKEVESTETIKESEDEYQEDEPEDENFEKEEVKECDFVEQPAPNDAVFSVEDAKEVVQFVKVNDEDVDINTLLEKFTAVSEELSNSKQELEKLNTQFAALQADITARDHKEMELFAQNMINSEEELSDEADASIKQEMFSSVKTDIDANKFSSMEDVQKSVTTMLAVALYTKKQSNKNSTQKEFSVSIPTIVKNVENVVKSDAEILKEASKKLENI